MQRKFKKARLLPEHLGRMYPLDPERVAAQNLDRRAQYMFVFLNMLNKGIRQTGNLDFQQTIHYNCRKQGREGVQKLPAARVSVLTEYEPVGSRGGLA